MISKTRAFRVPSTTSTLKGKLCDVEAKAEGADTLGGQENTQKMEKKGHVCKCRGSRYSGRVAATKNAVANTQNAKGDTQLVRAISNTVAVPGSTQTQGEATQMQKGTVLGVKRGVGFFGSYNIEYKPKYEPKAKATRK